MKLIKVSKWLVLIGAIELGLVGVFNFSIFGVLLGSWPTIIRIIYIAIGVCGFWGAYNTLTKKKKK